MTSFMDKIGLQSWANSISDTTLRARILDVLVSADGDRSAAKSWTRYDGELSATQVDELIAGFPAELIGLHAEQEADVRYSYHAADGSEAFVTLYLFSNGRKARVRVFGISTIPEPISQYIESYGFVFGDADDTSVLVHFCFPSSDGEITEEKYAFVAISLASIEENYTPSVVAEVRTMLETLKTTANGLVILHGPTGTGKTYLIRAMLSELKKLRDGVICNPSTVFLQDARMLSQAARVGKSPLITLEDLGTVFHEDRKTYNPDQFSNLANFADGLQSVLTSAVFVLTFNEDIKQLDPALTRPGRCIANIYVPNLPRAQAERLVGKKLSNTEYSLAEVYALKEGKGVASKPALGFKSMRYGDAPADSDY